MRPRVALAALALATLGQNVRAQSGAEFSRPRIYALATGGTAITLNGRDPGLSVGLGLELELEPGVSLRGFFEHHRAAYRELGGDEAVLYAAADAEPETRGTAFLAEAVLRGPLGPRRRLHAGVGFGPTLRRLESSFIRDGGVEFVPGSGFSVIEPAELRSNVVWVPGVSLSPAIEVDLSSRLRAALVGRLFVSDEVDGAGGRIRIFAGGEERGFGATRQGDLNAFWDNVSGHLLVAWRMY